MLLFFSFQYQPLKVRFFRFFQSQDAIFPTKLSEFPSWEPDSNEVLCAKFLYFYEQRCFTPYIRKLEKKMFEYRGLKRLQGKQTAVEKKTKSC